MNDKSKDSRRSISKAAFLRCGNLIAKGAKSFGVFVNQQFTKIGSAFWVLLPAIFALAAVGFVIYTYVDKTPGFVDLQRLPMGDLNKAQEQTLTMIRELNKFLISLVTLMFGGVAFFLMHYRKEVRVVPIAVGLLFALVLLGVTYFFGFMTYSQLTTELAQNALGVIPGKSRILYYLELEFWTFLGASLTILLLFVFVLFTAK